MIKNKLKMLAVFCIGLCSFVYANSAENSITFIRNLQQIEKETNGHIGLSAINTANNTQLEYHGNETFPMGCTSKVIGVASILKQSMTNEKLLGNRIYYKRNDLVNWTPVTANHIHDGMTVKELCQAAIEQSDNTAMNLLVTWQGGLNKINQFARTLGNKSFRQDRNWPGEALAVPGGVKDSSTPNDMEQSYYKLLFDDVLAKPQRDQLQIWMKACKTGNNRIRRGIPPGWIVGDKTGSGYYYAITNDVAVVWPPKCAPIVMAIYYYRNGKNMATKEEVLGKSARLIIDEFAKNDICLKEQLH